MVNLRNQHTCCHTMDHSRIDIGLSLDGRSTSAGLNLAAPD
jgi:hypothetical protein